MEPSIERLDERRPQGALVWALSIRAPVTGQGENPGPGVTTDPGRSPVNPETETIATTGVSLRDTRNITFTTR
jgi:hypothetical protein